MAKKKKTYKKIFIYKDGSEKIVTGTGEEMMHKYTDAWAQKLKKGKTRLIEVRNETFLE